MLMAIYTLNFWLATTMHNQRSLIRVKRNEFLRNNATLKPSTNFILHAHGTFQQEGIQPRYFTEIKSAQPGLEEHQIWFQKGFVNFPTCLDSKSCGSRGMPNNEAKGHDAESFALHASQWNKDIQQQLWNYLEQLPFSCCMYASHLLKSLGYLSLQCFQILISQV